MNKKNQLGKMNLNKKVMNIYILKSFICNLVKRHCFVLTLQR